MKILIATDAWSPQINGVVRSLERLVSDLRSLFHEVRLITPDQFEGRPCPTYAEIKLSKGVKAKVRELLNRESFDAIHIATEGPIGLAVRRVCLQRGLEFTTAYHTRFPEYIHARFGLPVSLLNKMIRWFHRPSGSVMVATPSLARELEEKGFQNLRLWSRGVDIDLFHPKRRRLNLGDGPIFLYVGRVAVEKNIEAFLKLDLPGTKVVVGDGPQLKELKQKYPKVRFEGFKQGEDLAEYYASSDVFVFPSRTDTFGLVLLEALASGTPVAAYPVMGPQDIIGSKGPGFLSEDLQEAALKALECSRKQARTFAESYSWLRCSKQFLRNLCHRGEAFETHTDLSKALDLRRGLI